MLLFIKWQTCREKRYRFVTATTAYDHCTFPRKLLRPVSLHWTSFSSINCLIQPLGVDIVAGKGTKCKINDISEH